MNKHECYKCNIKFECISNNCRLPCITLCDICMDKQKTLDDTCKHERVEGVMLPTYPPKYKCKYCGTSFTYEGY